MKIRKPRGMPTSTVLLGTGLGAAVTFYVWYPVLVERNKVVRKQREIEAKVDQELQAKKQLPGLQAPTGS